MRARRLSKRNFPLKRDSKSDRVSERARVRAEQTNTHPPSCRCRRWQTVDTAPKKKTTKKILN